MGKSAQNQTNFSKVQNILRSFLAHFAFNFPRPSPESVTDLYQSAVQEATRRGVPLDCKGGELFFGSSLVASVGMTVTTYAHVENESIRMLITFFTACTIYLDDAAQLGDNDVVERFNERFSSGEQQPDPVLALLGDVLREMYQHFGRVEANTITTSALNLCTATVLEFRTEELGIKATVSAYAAFYRTLAGATDAFAFFIFDPKLSIAEYIQAIPDLGIILNHVNDIMSLYKEEKVGDDVNYISLLAQAKSIQKIEALQILVKKCIKSHENIVRILAPSKEASMMYEKFIQGYLAFHVYTERYKLHELGF
ncbi:hypothetical protein VKT23_006424 [Stygiomarasmius scandens]|uniref:Terpenoid synthase n=1 Tax=Marasmiellus scandens TaxID=2682957 RepID=A0ABR1JMT8_9AGAR